MYWGGELFWEELTTQGWKIEMPKWRAIVVTGKGGIHLKLRGGELS